MKSMEPNFIVENVLDGSTWGNRRHGVFPYEKYKNVNNIV